MERLIHGTGDNSPEAYDRIYADRAVKGADAQDLKRWKLLLKHYKGGKLCDLGCLDSQVPELALRAFPNAEVWGIDLAAEAIQAMQIRIPQAIFQVADVYQTKFPSNYFDYLVAGELIEHLEDPQRFIAEAFRILKKGGVLALSVPENEAREPGAVDGHRHIWSYTTDDIVELCKPYKVKTRIIGSQYFPTYIYHWPSIIAYAFKR